MNTGLAFIIGVGVGYAIPYIQNFIRFMEEENRKKMKNGITRK